jgi:23S rRNA (adenine2503-C2)-methyltransferase
MIKTSLCGLTADEIFSLIRPWGFTLSHAVSISNSIYKKGATEITDITKIPKKLRKKLSEEQSCGIYQPIAYEVSSDNTVKYLFRTETGKEFETVYIPDKKRNTVCISTQSGCRMGCPFCVTSKFGFRGNLSAGDIVNQIISIPAAGKITHIVFMGMGEPMDNLENVLKACKIITSEWGLAISPRNVTVSTVGITPAIVKFLESSECNLTLSLHSPFVEERKIIVPVEKKYPSHKILEILKNFPVRKKRRISLAYVLIEGLNDTDKHLEGLINLLKGSRIRVNLLPYHPTKNDANASSSEQKMNFFKHNLVTSGISSSIRKSRGIDISAACGLLASGLK